MTIIDGFILGSLIILVALYAYENYRLACIVDELCEEFDKFITKNKTVKLIDADEKEITEEDFNIAIFNGDEK